MVRYEKLDTIEYLEESITRKEFSTWHRADWVGHTTISFNLSRSMHDMTGLQGNQGNWNRGPFHERFFRRKENPMESWDRAISVIPWYHATKFCACSHDSTAVMPYAKFHNDHFIITWMKAE